MSSLARLNEINYLVVVVASIVAFALSAAWYAQPVFGAQWSRHTGRTAENTKGENRVLTMGLAFLATLVGVFALALFIGKDAGAGHGALAGLVAGLGFASMSVVINGIFEGKSPQLMAINCGYQTLLFTVAGLILGAWG